MHLVYPDIQFSAGSLSVPTALEFAIVWSSQVGEVYKYRGHLQSGKLSGKLDWGPFVSSLKVNLELGKYRTVPPPIRISPPIARSTLGRVLDF